MRRQRGFTLMEILIAMALTSIVTTSVLAIVRTQLSTLEQNDQVMRTQQNARAAMDFVETIVRRACGGINSGSVGVNVPSGSKTVPCLQTYDGAAVNASTITSGSVSDTSDAIEVIYATGTMTAISSTVTSTTLPGAVPASLLVNDVTGFSKDDYILVTDSNYNTAWMFQIDTPVPGAPSSGGRVPGTLPIQAPSGTISLPMPTAPTVKGGSPVFKAATYSFFVAPPNVQTYAGMLMVDPNGVASNNHLDYNGKVQPAVEGVVDFQVAVGADTDNDGLIDLWYRDGVSETVPGIPWGAGASNLKQVRLSLLLQTLNSYTGAQPDITPFEDRTVYPSTHVAYQPRYRSASMIVAPRAWNLTE